MFLFTQAIALLGLLPNLSQALQNCPLLGPDFPSPMNLSSNAALKAALANFTSILNAGGIPGSTYEQIGSSDNTTFSFEMFSAHESNALFDYHHSATALNMSTSGVKKVDSNSIYRIGSVSKIFAVYALLIEEGDVKFNDPITKYVPELKAAAKAHKAYRDAVNYVDWDAVTVGALASQTADIGRDYSTLGELTQSVPNGTPYGLPPLNASEIPVCGGAPLLPCDRKAFFEGYIKRHPVYAPSTTPIYSNVAFQILSYALEDLTGKKFEKLLQDDILNKLGMSHTSLNTPNTTFAVIPDSIAPGDISSQTTSGWNQQIGDEGPAGSIYSSTHDMSIFGRSILLSSLLPAAVSRRWLKPVTFTSDIYAAVGAPWEIRRLSVSYPPYVIDAYAKKGGIGVYESYFALLPDFDVGYTILTVGPGAGLTLESVSNLFGEIVLPALEVAARYQATAVYAGHYASPSSSLNSSLTLTTDASHPGLRISSWISNDTDMLSVAGSVLGEDTNPPVVITLYPTNLKTETKEGTNMAWRAVVEFPLIPTDTGLFSSTCASWAAVDGEMWDSVAFDDFLFTLGRNGKAVSVRPRALRVTLQKVE